MPLNTRIIRDGKPLDLRWGGFHVASMVYACVIDSGEGPFVDNASVREQALALMEKDGAIAITPKDAFDLMSYPVIGQTPLNAADYTMVNYDLKFVDIEDGEELEIEKGDVLSMSRS